MLNAFSAAFVPKSVLDEAYIIPLEELTSKPQLEFIPF